MKNGMFVFDAVIHMQDTRPQNKRSPIADQIAGHVQLFLDGIARLANGDAGGEMLMIFVVIPFMWYIL